MSSPKERFEEFRWLWKALVIYLVAAWIGYEVIQALTEGLGLPSWFPALAVVLFIVGLPIILVTAFVQHGVAAPERHDPTLFPDAEPDAERRAVEAPPWAASQQGPGLRRFFTWRNAIMGGAIAFGLWGVIATAWLLRQGRQAQTASGADVASAVEALPGGSSALAPEYVASVAVLPFQDLAGTRENDYFSEGITEEIISQLARVEGLKVISRTSVVALKGTLLTTPQIADTLGVRHVLEGTVRRWGDRVRVTVQLIDAETDAHLWAESYTRTLADLFDIQEEIAEEVSSALVTTFPGLRPSGARSRTDRTAAYEAFLSGKYWVHGRTLEGLRRAIEAFEEAIELDPAYAPAYAGLSTALGLWVFYSAGPDSYAAWGRALALADRATELDPNLAEGYYARAYISNKMGLPAQTVAADFEKALQLQPNSADLHGWYAHFLLREGQIEEALAEHETAVELDPLAPGRRNGFAIDALAAQRYDLALHEARRALALEPELVVPRVYEALALLLLARSEECAALDLGPRAAIKALCLHSFGQTGEAAEIVDSLASAIGKRQGDRIAGNAAVLSDIAMYFAWIGDARAALDWVERAFALSPFGFDTRYVGSGLFDKVRDDPEFQSGLERMREEASERVRRERLAAKAALEGH